jgi:hypothetical protein
VVDLVCFSLYNFILMRRLIEKITPFMVMDILARTRMMPDAVHMEVKEPDLPPPGRVMDAYEGSRKEGDCLPYPHL